MKAIRLEKPGHYAQVQIDEPQKPVIRDNRKVDPVTGGVRQPDEPTGEAPRAGAEAGAAGAQHPEHEELRLKLALVKTTFARFDAELCRQLVYRGWWLAGCSIATFHRDLIEELPQWRPLTADESGKERGHR